ncbi:MAG: matrixin family metalloprotease, partial [Burkholderiales bacterium]
AQNPVSVDVSLIPFDVTPDALRKLLQTEINAVILDDGKVKSAYDLDVKPKVFVNGAGTQAFPWQITFGNMGAVTVSAAGSSLDAMPASITRQSASGVIGTVTGITDLKGSSSQDRFYGIQRELLVITEFAGIGGTDAPAISANKDALVFGESLALQTGQAVLYEVNAGHDTVNGLESGKIYFVGVSKAGSETTVRFFSTPEAVSNNSNAIRLTDPVDPAKNSARHTLKDVPVLRGGNGESWIVSTLSNDAGAIFGSGGADVLFGSNGADYIAGGDGKDVLFADGSHTGTRDIYKQTVTASDGVDAFILVFDAELRQINSDDTIADVVAKLSNLDGIAKVIVTHEEGDELWHIDYEAEPGAIGSTQFETSTPGVSISQRAIPDNADGVFGGIGDDIIVGYSGADYLVGGEDNDTLVGGAGSDTVEAGSGTDTIAVIESGKVSDYDVFIGGTGSDTYLFQGDWGVASIKETGTGDSGDLIDLSELSQNYTHILSNGNLYSTAGSLYESEITFANGTVMKLGTVLESLKGDQPSPGQIVTQWGFGFHQEASGSTLSLSNATAALTAFAKPTEYGQFDFLLRVDRGDGAEIFDVSVNVGANATNEQALAAIESALAKAVTESNYGYETKATAKDTLAAAGLSVRFTDPTLGVGGGKLQIVASANGTIEKGLISTHYVPAKLELTVKSANTIVAGGDNFEGVDKIKLGDGANTFVFGNDYWGGGSDALSLAQALPLVNVAARNAQGALTVDSSDLLDEQSGLVLDFRAVNYELRFNFAPTDIDGVVELTVSTVQDLTMPLVDAGPDIRDNKIVFTHVDKNAVIYGGRYLNTFNFDKDATFEGKLVGGEGGAIGGILTFPGRATDIARETLALAQNVAFDQSLAAASDVFFQVQNVLSYSNPTTASLSNDIAEIGNADGASSKLAAALKPGTYINLQDLKLGSKTLSDFDKAWQYASFNLFGPLIDKFAHDNGWTTTGFSGNTENTSDAGLGDVIVRSGINLVRGTDYTPSVDTDDDSLAFFRSGADHISIGDNILSVTPGLHVLAGGSGADTYSVRSQWWGAALMLDDIASFDLSLEGIGVDDAWVDAVIPQDTLDFSGMYQDLYYTIYSLSTNDIAFLENTVKENGVGIGFPLELGATVVVVTGWNPFGENETGNLSLSGLFERATDGNLPISQANIAIAVGVENIVGSRGANTFTFLDGSRVNGRISPGYGGSVNLNYAEYHGGKNDDTQGVLLDLNAGGELEVIPAFDGLLGLPDWAKTLADSIKWQFGSATGSGGGVRGVSEGGNVVGSDYDDLILANFSDNDIQGAGGADTIHGELGNDKLNGGNGSDVIVGGPAQADDVSLFGGSSTDHDVIDAGAGDDLIFGGYDNDTLIGGAGSDLVEGGTGTDTYIVRSASTDADGLITRQSGETLLVISAANPGLRSGDVTLGTTQLVGERYRQNVYLVPAYSDDTFELVIGAAIVSIDRSNAVAELEQKLTDLGMFKSVSVDASGLGTEEFPWVIEYTVDFTSEGEFATEALKSVTVRSPDPGENDVQVNVDSAELVNRIFRQTLEGADGSNFNVTFGDPVLGTPVTVNVVDIDPGDGETAVAADDLDFALESFDAIDRASIVSGDGSEASPWVIDYEVTADALDLTQEAETLTGVPSFDEQDTLFGGIENIFIGHSFRPDHLSKPSDVIAIDLPTDAAFFVGDGSEQTITLNPTNMSEGTYHFYLDANDKLDVKGYGSSKVDMGTYDSANKTQTLVFYSTLQDRIDGINPILTAVVNGLDRAIWEFDFNFTREEPLLATAAGNAAAPVSLQASDLEGAFRAAAEERWLAQTEELSLQRQLFAQRLAQYQFIVTDLPGLELAQSSDETIAFDIDAAGHGWFIDPSPDNNDEFDNGVAIAGQDSEGKYDLLSVMVHEMGHALGLVHDTAPDSVMNKELAVGERPSISLTPAELDSLPSAPHGGSLNADLSDQERIEQGLAAFGAWAENFSSEVSDILSGPIDLPFIDLGLDTMWDTTGGVIATQLNDWVGNDIRGIFESGEQVDADSFIALDTVSASRSGRLGEFQADVEITSTGTGLTLSLDKLSDLIGVDLSEFATLEQAVPLDLEAAIDLRFNFGLDGNGEFFVEDPTLVARVTASHDDPLDVSLFLGPLGVGIVDGTLFFEAGFVLPTEGRYGVGEFDQFEIEAPHFDPQSSYEVDLPVKLLGPLAGFGDDIGRIYGSFNRGDTALSAENLSLTQFLTLIPQTLNFDGNFGALFDLGNISLDQALEGIKQALQSAISDDGIATQKLPFVNKSALELLGSGDVVEQMISAIEVVQENLSDINHVEIDVNRELDRVLDFAGLDVGEKDAGVEAAYNALVAISTSLNGQSSDEAIAVALAQLDYAAQFADLQLSRDMLAAQLRITDLGLDETATTLQIATALGDPGELLALTSDRDDVAADATFVDAWALLKKTGLGHNANQADVDALFDNQDSIDLALDALAILNDANATQGEKQVASLTLLRLGIAPTTDPADVPGLLDRSADKLAAEDALAYVNDDDPARVLLLAAALRLDAAGVNANSTELALAVAVAGVENVQRYESDLAFLQRAAITPAQAQSNLDALGLSDQSADLDIALALLSDADPGLVAYEAAKTDRNTLATYDANKLIDFEYAGSVLEVDFGLGFVVAPTEIDLDFSLEDLPGLGPLLTSDPNLALVLEVTKGQVFIEADIDFDLNFAFDLSNLGSPEFIIADDSQITFDKLVIRTDEAIDIEAGLVVGGERILTAAVKDAEIFVDLTGSISLVNDPTDNSYLIDELVNDSSLWNVDLLGTVQADLPMFFPTDSLPLGGTTEDLNGDGIADNVLHVDGVFRGPNDYDLKFAAPGIGLSMQDLFALLNDPQTLLTGLEGFFSGIDKIADGIDAVEVPLVGGSAFDDLAASLRGMRTSVLGEILVVDGEVVVFEGEGNPLVNQAKYSDDSLGRALQEMIVGGDDDVFGKILDLLRNELFKGLKDIDSPLFSFVTPKLSISDELQFDDNGKIITKAVESPDDIQLVFSPERGVLTFNIMFAGVLVGNKEEDGSVTPAGLPIDFSVGIPGINLDVDANLLATIDYTMGLGLGLGGVGVFLDTSGINADGEEIALDIDASLEAGSTAEGTLGFLKMDFEDVNDAGGSGIHGHLGLDIRDGNDDGVWAPLVSQGDPLSVAITASAYVDADISAKVATSAGAYLPSVSTTIHYDQVLGDFEISTDGGARFDMGSPQVVLEDVTLNVGSVFDSFLGDALDTIADIITPLGPLVKMLTTEIDLGITSFQLLDLAYLKLPAKTVEQAKSVLAVLDSTIEFLDKVDAMSDAGGINFGTFNLTETSLENPSAPTSEDDVSTSKRDDKDLTNEQKETLKGPDQKGLDERPASSTGSTSGEQGAKRPLPSKSRFSIPLLEDPASLIDFVLDRGPVDLFYYDLPDLDLLFEYSKTYPVYPGLNAGLFGSIGATTNFDFGFDTRGLQQWMDKDFAIADVDLIFNGFYLDDHGAENTPDDLPEATITAAVGAIASLGISGLVEAGVKGGIEAEIDFDLNDKVSLVDGQIIGDGKMYGGELLERLSHGPLCVFDMAGELSVFMEAFFWVGINLGFSEITLFEASERFVDEVIAEFDFECVLDKPEDLAILDTGSRDLALRYLGGEDTGPQNYVIAADVVSDSLTVESAVERGYIDPELYTESERTDLQAFFDDLVADHDGEDLIVVSTGARAEFFLAADVDTIRSVGTDLADHFVVKAGVAGLVQNIELFSGGGDDVIELFADDTGTTLTSLLIDAEGGNDYIRVDPGLLGMAAPDAVPPAYVVRGGSGDDRIKLAKSADEDAASSIESYNYTGVFLYGDDGDDIIMGHSGADIVDGGEGDDTIMTYRGADEISGGGGNDFIVSGSGADRVWGDDGNDQIVAGGGADEVYGGKGNDVLKGEDGMDVLHGDEGDDVLIGGLDDDELHGGRGDDVANWELGDGVDTFDGDEGSDQLSMRGYMLDEQAFYNDPDNYVIDDGLADVVVINANAMLDDAGNESAEVVWTHGLEPTLTIITGEVETLKLDAGRGADDFLVNDMQTTSVGSVRVSSGQNQGIVEEVNIARDREGRAQGQDLQINGSVGQEFGLRIGAYGSATRNIVLEDDGTGNVDKQATAIQIQAALQELLGDESIDVFYDPDIERYKVTGLTDAADAILVTDANVDLFSSSMQILTLEGDPEQMFGLRFGPAGDSMDQSVQFVIDEFGEVDEAVTAVLIGDALQQLTGNDAIQVLFDEVNSVYLVSGLEVGSEALELDDTLSDAGVTASATIVQELDIEGPAGQVFGLRFGSGGDASALATLVDDGFGNVDTTQTAASIQGVLRDLTGNASLQVGFESDSGLYVVSGFSASAGSIEVVNGDNGSPVLADVSTTQMLALTGTAGSLFRLQYGDAGLATDFIMLGVSDDGGVDETETASTIQAALRSLVESRNATVVYDTESGKYIVSGLDGSTALLQVNTSEILTDVVGSSIAVRNLALSGDAGQQFRVRMGVAGELSGLVTLVDDGSDGIDTSQTALSLQQALRNLSGNDGVTVVFDENRGVYSIAGLNAPDDTLQLDNDGLVTDVTGESRPGGVVFKVFKVGGDEEIDSVVIKGSHGADDYRVSTVQAIGIDGKSATSLRYEQLNGETSENGQLLSHVVVDVFGLETADYIRLDALDGNDRIDARGVNSAVVADLILDGGADDDTIIGSNQGSISDVIVGGTGSDKLTGGAGVDRFYELVAGEAGNLIGDIDTLIETRDADFELSNTRLRIDDTILHNQYGNEVETFDDIFEDVELYGLSGANRFQISGWSDSGVLDGYTGGDTYVLELATTVAGRQFFNINDTGGSAGIDSLTYKGSANNDTIQLDTVYDPALDEDKALTDARWLEYGEHGDGLIIGHFDAASSGYETTDINDEEKLMEVKKSELVAGTNFQVVNYETVEEVVVFGGEGDDNIISDDTAARFNVFGNAGDDKFHVGSVVEVEDVIVEGQIVTVVKEITRGVSFDGTAFYGGDGDDYFEVNHNAAEISLYGDNGDDVFLVKALLTVDEDGELFELDSKTSTVSGNFGEDSEEGGVDINNDTREIDIDTLVYVENANVSIDGGAGFDAVSLVGTVLSDTFYVYTETDPETGDNVQRIFGAGVKLQQLLNIEQIQLLTGGGDDTIYLYGVDMGVIGDMVIRTGTGSDTVIVGGPEQTITQIFPRSSQQFYSTVEGYQVDQDAVGRFVRVGEVDGLPFYEIRELTRIVGFAVESPGRSTQRIMPASYDTSAFRSPVVIDGGKEQGDEINDEIIFNLQEGTPNVRLTNGVLTKKDALFDAARIELVSEAGDPDSDLPAILLAGPGETGVEARDLLTGVVTDYVRFTDRYYEPGLVENLAALGGSETQDVVVPEGVSYYTIETTLVDNEVVTAREQLIEFADNFGLDLEWNDVPHPDPSRAATGEVLHELLSIHKGDASIAFEAIHVETVVLDGNTRGVVKDLAGLTLKTTAPLRATFSAGAVTSSLDLLVSGLAGDPFRFTSGGDAGEVITLIADPDTGDVDRGETASLMQSNLRTLLGSELVVVKADDAGIYHVRGLDPEAIDLQIDVDGLSTTVSGSFSLVSPVEVVRVDPVNTMIGQGEDAHVYFSGFESLDINLSEATAAGSELYIDNDLYTGLLNVHGGKETDRIYIEKVVTDTVVHGGDGNDVITVGDAGLLDDVGAQLYLFGDEGDDEVIVEGYSDADGANVSIDKNVLEHATSFEQVSRVTDALGLQGVTTEENAILEDQLKDAALPYGQAAMDVDASDLTTYRDYAADALLAELKGIVDDLEAQLGTEIDDAIGLLQETDLAMVENQVKLYLRTRYYEDVNIEDLILSEMENNGVETYLQYIDYDWEIYVVWKKGWLGIPYPVFKSRWVVDKSDSAAVTADWGIKSGLQEIQKFFQNPDAHFKTYGLAGVSNDSLSKKYLGEIQNLLANQPLYKLLSDSLNASNKLKLLGGGKLDDDEYMRLYLKTKDTDTAFERANSLALAKIYDELRDKSLSHQAPSSIYRNLLIQRGYSDTELNTLYAQYGNDDAVHGFSLEETNYSKSRMVGSVDLITLGDVDLKQSQAVIDKIAHLDGTYRQTYLDKVSDLRTLIESARTNDDYSADTLNAIKAGVDDLKEFLKPTTEQSVDTAAGGEGQLIKAQAYNLFATTTGNGIADRIGDLASLGEQIVSTNFDAVTTVDPDADFATLSGVFNGSDYEAIRAVYQQASEVVSDFTLFNARYLGGAEAPVNVGDAASAIRQLDAVADRFAAFDEAVSGGFVFDDFRDAFLSTQQEITTFIEVNPDYINNILVASRAGAQADSLQLDLVDVSEPAAVNRIQYDLFKGALDEANADLVTLKAKLRKEYTYTWNFWWFSIKVELDYTGDARYKQQLSLIKSLNERVVASDRFADRSDAKLAQLQARKAGYESERDTAEALVADKRDRYEELKQTINGQFAVLKELSKFAIDVLKETREGEPISGFVDTNSLISQLRSFSDVYTVLSVDGVYVPVDTQEFLEGEGSNSVVLSEEHVSYTDITTISGMSPYAVHVGYDDVEELTVVLGDAADQVRVRDTLGTAGARVTVLGRGGDDVIEVGNIGSVDDILGTLVIDAGAGMHNVLTIDDSMDEDPDHDVVITDSRVIGLAPGDIHYTATGGHFGSYYLGMNVGGRQFTPGVSISGGTGGNTITIESSRGDSPVVELTLVNSGQGG